MAMDITLTLNAVVTIRTACFIHKKSAFCPNCVCGSYSCLIIPHLLHGCNSYPEDGGSMLQWNIDQQPKKVTWLQNPDDFHTNFHTFPSQQ